MPGEGVEPSRPRLGTAGFKPAAYVQFRHPGGAQDSSEGLPGAFARIVQARGDALRPVAAVGVSERLERRLVECWTHGDMSKSVITVLEVLGRVAGPGGDCDLRAEAVPLERPDRRAEHRVRAQLVERV